MTPPFATRMTHWKDWQRAYRFGVILIYPPEPIRSAINALRAKYDPVSHAWSDAHISLSVPAPAPPTAQEWETLATSVESLSPTVVEYGPVKTFKTHPGVVLDLQPQGALDMWRSLVESTPPFSDAAARRWSFSAHMTIAELVTADESEKVIAELARSQLSGSFLCTHLSYAVPNELFRFEEHGKLHLRGIKNA